MTDYSDNQSWLHESGYNLSQKKDEDGFANLNPWDRLIYCLWIADFGIRKEGSLSAAMNMYEDFQTEGKRAAQELSLRHCHKSFSLAPEEFGECFLENINTLCDEVRKARQISEAFIDPRR